MSRDIKFKLWLTSTRKMTYEHTLDELVTLPRIPLNAIALQYTGLKDRNGKEIYDGDIVALKYNGLGSLVIEFKDGAFNISRYRCDLCEVIGSIYENQKPLGGGEG